ncbi:MAG: hypothetical protein RI902_2580 [Pseudomonadota bacterium]|jgi:hypothetical protein
MIEKDKSVFALFAASSLAGVAFCASHLLNAWLFQAIAISDHISLIYLPAFFRLFNVLVLGLMWGTLGTAIGGVLLLAWTHDATLSISLLNMCVSAGVAAISVVLLQMLLRRRLSITRLNDLLLLSVLYALMNALMHHVLWTLVDPSQLLYPRQVFEMMLGDLGGAVLGAWLLRLLSRNTALIKLIRARKNAYR